jgi:hypothetical protein
MRFKEVKSYGKGLNQKEKQRIGYDPDLLAYRHKVKDIYPVKDWQIMPQTIKPMGLIHLPGAGPNNRFDFKNKGNNRVNEDTLNYTQTLTKMLDETIQKKKAKKKHKREWTAFEMACMEGGHPLPEDAAGVGIITKQNTTKDVKPGDEYKNVKKLHLEYKEFLENFADGKVKGKSRPGRVKRAGASCKGSVSSLRAKAKKYGGERGKMYHWCANMKSGRK